MSIPLKFPVAGSMLKTFTMAPRRFAKVWVATLRQDAVADGITRARATVKRYVLRSNLVEYVLDPF
jgi:hypothetical protein